jgi:crotonobetainyl-CoA:carnitine CoA-transferase CaiB-like acyl-CoA transferase
MWVDLAMYQVGVTFVGEGLLDFAFNGRRTRRWGNRHSYMSPHGCYPCAGDDEWVALAVRDGTEWAGFCQVIGQAELAGDSRFADPISRNQYQDDLDAIIGQWTSVRTQNGVMRELQSRGIPAGPVLNAKQLLADPHLRSRGFFERVEHPPETGLGIREYVSRGWKLSGTAIHIPSPAPTLGEGNEYVLRQVLGLGSSEVEKLREEGAIGQELEGAGIPAVVPLDQQVELGWVAGYDAEFEEFLARAVDANQSDPQ